MERKVGEVFNDGDDLIEVVISENGNCTGCHYWGSPCEDRDECCKGLRSDSNSVIFKKIGELKMETEKQMLLKQIAEMEQREKDNQKTLEEMRKKVEKLEEKQSAVSATGVLLEEPQKNSTFFANHGDNSTQTENYNFEKYEQGCFNVNNVFSTKEQAESEALRREGQEFIRRCAMLWNKDHDWRKKIEMTQSCIFMTNLFDLKSINYSGNTYGQIFFDNYELAERCIAELEKKYNEKQLKIIFGVK